MAEWKIHILIMFLSFFGFLSLALTMTRHQEDLFGKERTRSFKLRMRLLGWLLLFLAAIVATVALGVGFGLTAYSGHASISAGLVLVLLMKVERRAKTQANR